MFFQAIDIPTAHIKNGARRVATMALSLSLVLSMVGCGIGQLNIQASAQGMSPDQDSLLPPEVVPLDPAAATQLAQSEAQSRQANMSNFGGNTGNTGSSIGNNNIGNNNIGTPEAQESAPDTQSAQDFRKAAFDSLYGQGQFPTAQPQANPNMQAMQGQMGQMPGQPGGFNNGQNIGFNSGMNCPMNSAQNPAQMAGGMQTQTLSGSVSTPQTQTQPSKVGKAYHAVSLATNLGGLGLMGAMMSRNPRSMFGLGLMGVGLLNYGMRGGKF